MKARLRFAAGLSALPILATVPIIDVAANSILLDAVAFLNFAFELITLAGDLIKIVVSEFAPLLLDLALELLPVSFDAIPIHFGSSFSTRKPAA